MFHGCPLAFANDREPRGVDDEMDRSGSRDAVELDRQVLTPSRESRMVRGVEIDTHQGEDRAQEALRLPKRQSEHEPKCQPGLDRVVRELALRASSPGRRGSPCVDRVCGEPERHVAPPEEQDLRTNAAST